MKSIDPSSIGLSRLPRALLLDTNVMLLLVVGLTGCLGTLKGILEEIETEERYVPSEKASRLGPYLRVGLADAATIEACRDECLVVTDDLDLFLVLQEENVAVVNFNHLRVA